MDPTISCPFIAEVATMEEATTKWVEHAMVVHNYMDKQLNDPKTIEAVKKVAKTDRVDSPVFVFFSKFLIECTQWS